jgi:RNA polymerase sigma-70 factor (ECF subfamily)
MILSHSPMTGRESRNQTPPPDDSSLDPLLSDEPTIELVVKAQGGDRLAVEALLQRCLPQLKRWAHGKLPASARGSLDTGDLVQEAAMHVVQRLAVFQPRHVGAMQAYLRMSVINRIRDEIRRVGRHPAPVELPEDHPGDITSPLEVALQNESYERYRTALGLLKPREREMVVARVEAQWSMGEIARQFGMRTVDGARMAVSRALKKLSANISA